MNIKMELFNAVFDKDFFIECNNKIKNKNWEKKFKIIFFKNMKYYKKILGKLNFNEILNIIRHYYNNIDEIRYENKLLYDFLKSIPDIKFILKTRIKSINSILEKKLRKKDNSLIYDIDALTIIITEYKGKNILKFSDEEQIEIYRYIISKVDSFYSNINFYPALYGNNYIENPKIGKIIDINVKKQYLYNLNDDEVPIYFSFHKCYESTIKNRVKEIHINTFKTEKAIRGNTTLNHYIYKPFKNDRFLILCVPKHLDFIDDHVYNYNLIEGFDYNFYYKICFDSYLLKLK